MNGENEAQKRAIRRQKQLDCELLDAAFRDAQERVRTLFEQQKQVLMDRELTGLGDEPDA